ncbi:hypothetical protein NDU88_004841 [Pleurodeles waltl]|uniref:Uncharacterized protein n=1 Tax=Pleurodeles waltl TaxID=8319 RepID=A0AAV7LA76_PLEWA|nr:hypothetical protein NDU88_004841 [Pleurodeles waltl]
MKLERPSLGRAERESERNSSDARPGCSGTTQGRQQDDAASAAEKTLRRRVKTRYRTGMPRLSDAHCEMR